MKPVKRMLVLLLCAVLVVGVTACGGGKGEGGKTESGGGSDEVLAPMGGDDPFANIPEEAKKTPVTLAHYGSEGTDDYRRLFDQFTELTGIEVKTAGFVQADYVTKITQNIAAGSDIGLIDCNGRWPEQLQNAQPLNGIIDLEDDFWDDTQTQNFTVNGKTYFANSLQGMCEGGYMVFFNKKIFADNGITSPREYWERGEWTYENLEKCLRTVRDLGGSYVGGFADPDVLAMQLGTPLIMYDPEKSAFVENVDAQIEPHQWWADLVQEKVWSGGANVGLFASGRVGLYVSSLWGAQKLGYFKDMEDALLDVVPLPTSWKGKELKQTNGLRGWGIAKGCKNPAGAAYLMRYYLDYSYYGKAGISLFKNENLQSAWFDEICPELSKGAYVDASVYVIRDYIGKDNVAAMFPTAGKKSADIPNIYAAGKNEIVNAVKKATESVQKYAK